MISFSILIPIFNNIKYTKACIPNLKACIQRTSDLPAKFDIIVIDDGSTDGSGDWLRENHPDIIVLEGDGNLWWSGGINKGVDYVLQNKLSDYILWWNNDIDCADNYLVDLYKIVLDQGPNVILGSKIFDKVSNKIWSMGGVFNTRTGNYDQLGLLQDDGPKYSKVMDVDWLPGMGTTISANIYSKVGELDENNFPQYHGDLDYTLRCKLKGFKIKVYPQLTILNDTANSGSKSKETLKDILSSFTSMRSCYNIKKDITLYRKFTKTPFSYYNLIQKYFFYIGGFVKWKILGVFNIKKKS